MFRIRSGQMERLEASMEERFIQSVVSSLRASHPVVANSATQAGIDAVVRLGLTRARVYGLSRAEDYRLYLDLMLSLGSDFDTDPQYLWLRPFLEGMDGVSLVERQHLLRWHVSRYFGRINGPDYGVSALERFSQLNLPDLEMAGSDLPGTAFALATQLHPERMDYVGADALGSLLKRALSDGAEFGTGAPAASALIFSLMFRFGYGAKGDLLHPWIGEVLRTGSRDDRQASGQKIRELLSRARALSRALARQIREEKQL